jgi:hypothetical protein
VTHGFVAALLRELAAFFRKSKPKSERDARGMPFALMPSCWNYSCRGTTGVGNSFTAYGYDNRLCGILLQYPIEKLLGPRDGKKILVKEFSSGHQSH